MNEPYREWWMHSDRLQELRSEVGDAINISIKMHYPLWQVLPKTQGMLDGVIEYVEGLERAHWEGEK